MELPNSLVCRYCGDKLLPHSIRSHERSCRRKLVKIVDMLLQKESLKFDYPPEYSEWPIPSKSDLQKYNDHAQREFKEGQQACPRCGSRFSMFEMQDHVLKCEATEFVRSSEPQLGTKKLAAKPDEKRRDQTIQLSLGVPEVTEDTSNQGVNNKKEKHVYSEKDVKAIIKLTERVQKGFIPDNYKDVYSDNSIQRILHYYNRQESKNKEKGRSLQTYQKSKITSYLDVNNSNNNEKRIQHTFDNIPIKVGKVQEDEIRDGPDDRKQCKICKRMFAPNRIERHQRLCERSKNNQPHALKQPQQQEQVEHNIGQNKIECKLCKRTITSNEMSKHEIICRSSLPINVFFNFNTIKYPQNCISIEKQEIKSELEQQSHVSTQQQQNAINTKNNITSKIQLSKNTKYNDQISFGGRQFKFDDIPLPKTHNDDQVFEVAPEGPDNRVGCKICKRLFDPSRLNKHEELCRRVQKHQESKAQSLKVK
ncbi:C2HC-type_zinc-finger domain-containing protein [Hexamita inflata]|uniref:C2HC-type zinc-finger domain-containing protein n=1 Tax=Hexamita inflata TaxID=28002 RepID=A0AA86V1E5_9EUKA|nr:C2HC-type zinc-finger domain-containing protein [Hexamita inflata]